MKPFVAALLLLGVSGRSIATVPAPAKLRLEPQAWRRSKHAHGMHGFSPDRVKKE
jgi:hypothetical protein